LGPLRTCPKRAALGCDVYKEDDNLAVSDDPF
jgi:hypothetical protein